MHGRSGRMHHIRRFKEEDIYDVYRIASENLKEKYTMELIMDIYHLWEDGFYVACSPDIVGFICGNKNKKTARILMLAVDKNYRRMGIGTSLLNRFIAECRKDGLMSIRLEVRTDNREAIEFYQKFNFQIISFIPNYYTNGDSAYVMWRII